MTYKIEVNSFDDCLREITEISSRLDNLQSSAEVLREQAKFLTVSDVADIMGISKNAVREIFRRDDFPCCDYGKEMVVEMIAFIDYFKHPVKREEK